MDIFSYKFDEQESAQAAHEKILMQIGPIAVLEGKKITITAPEGAASDAAQICEDFGGKSTVAFLF